jgi:hypothetical protein
MRPRASFLLGERGISRFPCEVFPCVLGVCDRAGLRYALLYRRIRCCLPPAPTASASRRMCLSRLNTRPARSPVNASTPPLRAAPHDSGPVWITVPCEVEATLDVSPAPDRRFSDFVLVSLFPNSSNIPYKVQFREIMSLFGWCKDDGIQPAETVNAGRDSGLLKPSGYRCW